MLLLIWLTYLTADLSISQEEINHFTHEKLTGNFY